jgi:CubicO group peptidase (beta-lactamase class C family)
VTHKSTPEIWDFKEICYLKTVKLYSKKNKRIALIFKPGKEFRDSQANYLPLGMLIEKIRESFEKFIENQYKKKRE